MIKSEGLDQLSIDTCRQVIIHKDKFIILFDSKEFETRDEKSGVMEHTWIQCLNFNHEL